MQRQQTEEEANTASLNAQRRASIGRRLDHVLERREHLRPLARLEPAVRVDPEALGVALEDARADLADDLALHELDGGHDGRVDVVDAGAEVARVAVPKWWWWCFFFVFRVFLR